MDATRATIVGDIVYVPVERLGRFIGWFEISAKYFTEDELDAIRKDMAATDRGAPRESEQA